MTYLIFAIVQGLSVFAGELRSAQALSTESSSGIFRGSLTSGYHFNEKAPNSIKTGNVLVRPSRIEARKIEFQLDKKQALRGQATLYVCDDASTYCETHFVKIGNEFEKERRPFGKNKSLYQKALARANKENKPVFLEFSARWCPGCVRYEKEVFSTSEFKNKEKSILFVKVDVDLFENLPIIRKYDVSGIPTIVAINAQEMEIDRLSDFQTLDRLNEFLSSVEKDPVPANELVARAIKGDIEQKMRAGRRLMAVGAFEDSIKILSTIQPSPPELWTAKVNFFNKLFATDPKKKDEYVSLLRAAINSEPEGNRALLWRTELVKLLDKNSPERAVVLQAALKVSATLLQDEKKMQEAFRNDDVGEFRNFEKMLVAEEIVDLLENAEEPPEKLQEAWNQAVAIGEGYNISVHREGPALRWLIFLTEAQQFAKAEKWADRLLEINPKNWDVLRRKMKILLGLKKYQEAENIGTRIIVFTEGRNQFWVAENLAKAYIAQGKLGEARKLLKTYLARNEMDAENMQSTRKSFNNLLVSIK